MSLSWRSSAGTVIPRRSRWLSSCRQKNSPLTTTTGPSRNEIQRTQKIEVNPSGADGLADTIVDAHGTVKFRYVHTHCCTTTNFYSLKSIKYSNQWDVGRRHIARRHQLHNFTRRTQATNSSQFQVIYSRRSRRRNDEMEQTRLLLRVGRSRQQFTVM